MSPQSILRKSCPFGLAFGFLGHYGGVSTYTRMNIALQLAFPTASAISGNSKNGRQLLRCGYFLPALFYLFENHLKVTTKTIYESFCRSLDG